MLLSSFFAGAAFDQYFTLQVSRNPDREFISMFLPLSFGSLLTSSGLLCLSYSTSIALACLSSFPIGCGCAIFALQTMTIVQTWFGDNSRATATGIAMAGSGAGNFCISLALQRIIDGSGWRSALRYEALLVLVVSLFGSTLSFRKMPKPSSHPSVPRAASLTFRQCVREQPFIILILFKMVFGFGYLNFFVHVFAFAGDLGYSDDFAALALALVGASSTLGRVLLGRAADRIGTTRNLLLSMSALAICVLIWPHTRSKAAVLAVASCYGFFSGAFPSLPPSVLAEYFADIAPASIFKVIGACFLAEVLGTMLGPVIAGLLYEASGDYTTASLYTGGVMILAIVILSRIEPVETFKERHKKLSTAPLPPQAL
ncbi:hypothetical protein TeGR_g4309 [Tetraparma gracilis]|uniref:Major facilitator superfamily (MFS) profile domain-containing protein n=1 Tax=Tetraparma gracilis TaxID=2962635 RepID=A0ABQ6MR95_9STRA|nr:hypothetical protein TeGR_g4309 [Tetraparma gracilis]